MILDEKETDFNVEVSKIGKTLSEGLCYNQTKQEI